MTMDILLDQAKWICCLCGADRGLGCDCWTECDCGWSFKKGNGACNNPGCDITEKELEQNK